jgi:DNA-binding transcriptional ArsR family regulator
MAPRVTPCADSPGGFALNAFRQIVRYKSSGMTQTLVNDVGAALADPTRMMVLTLAASGTSTPSEIAAITGCSRATVTHHLLCLERAGLVERRRSGRQRLVLVRHDRMRVLLSAIEGFGRAG